MCQQIVQFCSGSTKPLLFAGSFLLLLLAIAIGYTGCTTNLLYQDIDPTVAQDKSITYYLQLAAAIYLALITIFASLAAYYDQKHSIRALSVITSINFVLAAAAILMAPTGPAVGKLFEERLMKAQPLYNFTDRYPIPPSQLNQTSNSSPSQSPGYNRPTRFVSDKDLATAPGGASEVVAQTKIVIQVNSSEATQIWDKLQARGCCGLLNATIEWPKTGYPKSCCSNPMEMGENQFKCNAIDFDHSKPCIEVIGSTGLNLLIVLALIALVNLYLATVTGISAYRTFHYNEASQNAYT